MCKCISLWTFRGIEVSIEKPVETGYQRRDNIGWTASRPALKGLA